MDKVRYEIRFGYISLERKEYIPGCVKMEIYHDKEEAMKRHIQLQEQCDDKRESEHLSEDTRPYVHCDVYINDKPDIEATLGYVVDLFKRLVDDKINEIHDWDSIINEINS